jgi:hypothetical protein
MQKKQGNLKTRVFQVEFIPSGILTVYKSLKLQERTNTPTVSLVPHSKQVDFQLYVTCVICII